MYRSRKLILLLAAALSTGAGIVVFAGQRAKRVPLEAAALSRVPERNETSSTPLPLLGNLLDEKKISIETITLGTGRSFSISRSGPMRPAGDALEYAERLLSLSDSGDASATYGIFLANLDCQNKMRFGGNAYRDVNPGKDPSKPINQADETARELQECEGLLTDKRFQYKNWLEAAAEQGSIEAMLMYPINPDHILGNPQEYALKPDLVQKWKDDSIQYLTKASSLGSVDALYGLSEAYDNGIIIDADPVEAYAYRLAVSKATGAAIDEEKHSDLVDSLTHKQIKAANDRSEEIINKCCIN
jgi:hypothetical protein